MAEKQGVPQAELLRRMGISKQEFDKYLEDTKKYHDKLDNKEREFYEKNNARTAKEIAESLGRDVTEADIERLFACAPHIESVFFVSCCKT